MTSDFLQESFLPSHTGCPVDRSARICELRFLGVGHTVALEGVDLGVVVSGRSGGGGVLRRYPRGFPCGNPFGCLPLHDHLVGSRLLEESHVGWTIVYDPWWF